MKLIMEQIYLATIPSENNQLVLYMTNSQVKSKNGNITIK